MPRSHTERRARGLRRSAAWIVLAAMPWIVGCPGTRTPGTAACPADRTVVLDAQDAVERFAACKTASSVTIRTGATIHLGPLRSLEVITGDLLVGPTIGLEDLSLLELREVGGSISVASNGSMRGLFLPRLERAGRLSIESNVGLTTISLPRLATVTGSLVITEGSSLEIVNLSALITVGKDLVITDNPMLALVEAAKLVSALEVRVERNRALPDDQVQALRARNPAPSPSPSP